MRRFLITFIGVVLFSATPFYCSELVHQNIETANEPHLLQQSLTEPTLYEPEFRIPYKPFTIYPTAPVGNGYYKVANIGEAAKYVSTCMTNYETTIKLEYTGTDYNGWVSRNLYYIFDYVYYIDTMSNLNDGERIHYGFEYATTSYNYTENSELITINIHYRQGLDKSKQDKTDAWIKSEYAKLNLGGKTEYQRFLAIYKWCLKFNYDYSYVRWSDYDAMTYGKTVCSGFAMLLDKMCEVGGIDCRCITGFVDSAKEYYHAWNYVRIGGKWYFCDPTWDEPDKGKSFNYYLMSYSNPQFSGRIIDDHFFGVQRNVARPYPSLYSLPFASDKYKIKIKYDTAKGNKIDSKMCRPGDEVVLKKPKRKGYKFKYYYIKDKKTKKNKRIKIDYIPFENVTVHAKWQKI